MLTSYAWRPLLALQGVDTVFVPHAVEIVDLTAPGLVPIAQLVFTVLWLLATIWLVLVTKRQAKASLRVAEQANGITLKSSRELSSASRQAVRAAEEANRITAEKVQESNDINRLAVEAAEEANRITSERTRESNKISRRAVEVAERATEHQIRVHETEVLLATYPVIHMTLQGSAREESVPGDFDLTLYNVGSTPAYDIEMYFIGYLEHDIEDVDDRGNYSIHTAEEFRAIERIPVPVLPKNHEFVKTVCTGQKEYQVFHVLVQFLDISGINHIERFTFSTYWYADDPNRMLNLTRKCAEPLKKHPRVTVSRREDESGVTRTRLNTEGEEQAPDYLSSNLVGAIERQEYYNLVLNPNFYEGKLVRSST